MKECGAMDVEKVKENIFILMDLVMMENGKTISDMDLENSDFQTKANFKAFSIWMSHQRLEIWANQNLQILKVMYMRHKVMDIFTMVKYLVLEERHTKMEIFMKVNLKME